MLTFKISQNSSGVNKQLIGVNFNNFYRFIILCVILAGVLILIKKKYKMGGWQLEVFKMTLYMSFPVAMFHIFNQPAYFEEWVTKTRRELYPPESLGHREEIQKAIKEVREKRDKEMLKALEDIEKREK